MAEFADLTRAFVADNPMEGARVLETVPPPDAAAFLSTCPGEVLAPVLAALRPDAANAVLGILPLSLIAEALPSVPAHEIAAMLRSADKKLRADILGSLPRALRGPVRRILDYSPDQVGAWTRFDFLIFADTETAAAALDRLREATLRIVDPVLLASEDGTYAGSVFLADIIRSQPERRLAAIADGGVRPLYDRSTVAVAGSLDIWAEHAYVPVIDGRNRILGALGRAELRRVLGDDSHARRALPGDQHPLLALTSGYSGMMSAALELLLGQGPAKRPRPAARRPGRSRR